jgi:hypothetical protein
VVRTGLVTAVAASTVLVLAQAADATWTLEQVPVPGSPSSASLLSVSCGSATACMAIGTETVRVNTKTGTKSFAEFWNGTSWAVVRTPSEEETHLASVSCTSASACTAVGNISFPHRSRLAVALRWDGTGWATQSVPSPHDSALESVSCTSPGTCVAVGSYNPGNGDLPFSATWNGTQWTPYQVPAPSGVLGTSLSSVSCVSGQSCIAIGNTSGPGNPVAESWNGASWTIQPTPLPAGAGSGKLSGVSCGSAATCVAVGYFYSETSGQDQPLAELWNGTSFTPGTTAVQRHVRGSALTSVSCIHARACTAAGQAGRNGDQVPLAEHWNGTRWSVQATADPPAQLSDLLGVSCPSLATCTAVGVYYPAQQHGALLAEQDTP